MREIKAIIRRDRLPDVLEALHERPELPGVTISLVDGVGRRTVAGAADAEYGEVQMAKLETVVMSDWVDWVVGAIQRAAYTGRPGDGKIFVIPVERAILIRSGDQGPSVL